ncbi:hypothetical protein ACE14D_16990, partial [Streptomyces sp. Act-28]
SRRHTTLISASRGLGDVYKRLVPAEAARRVATAMAADGTLRARLVRGLDLALLPSGATPPGGPFYVRE